MRNPLPWWEGNHCRWHSVLTDRRCCLLGQGCDCALYVHGSCHQWHRPILGEWGREEACGWGDCGHSRTRCSSAAGDIFPKEAGTRSHCFWDSGRLLRQVGQYQSSAVRNASGRSDNSWRTWQVPVLHVCGCSVSLCGLAAGSELDCSISTTLKAHTQMMIITGCHCSLLDLVWVLGEQVNMMWHHKPHHTKVYNALYVKEHFTTENHTSRESARLENPHMALSDKSPAQTASLGPGSN